MIGARNIRGHEGLFGVIEGLLGGYIGIIKLGVIEGSYTDGGTENGRALNPEKIMN